MPSEVKLKKVQSSRRSTGESLKKLGKHPSRSSVSEKIKKVITKIVLPGQPRLITGYEMKNV